MILERVKQILQDCDAAHTHVPPTVLFNEDWMLRIALDWLLIKGNTDSLIPILPGASWYSEALLASAFFARKYKDSLAEKDTHADGVIGHFRIGGRGKGDLVLLPTAKQLAILEAKMFSPLSKKITNADYYDQAARTVACIAEVLKLSNKHPIDMEILAFILIAPRSQIEKRKFNQFMSKESIYQKVKLRVSAYEGERDLWFQKWFIPLLNRITINTLSWEDIIGYISGIDSGFGEEAFAFYQKCIKYNQ